MPLDFPTNPVDGQQYTSGGITYTWSSARNFWSITNNGVRGFQGFQGVQGAQGFQGLQGIQGAQGSQGVQGAIGADTANNRVLKAGDTMTGLLNINSANALATSGIVQHTGTILDAPVIRIASGATYNDNAAGRVIFANSTVPITVTVAPSNTSGFAYTVIRGGSGNVIIANSGVFRFNSASISSLNVNLFGAVTILYTATNEVVMFGDFVA